MENQIPIVQIPYKGSFSQFFNSSFPFTHAIAQNKTLNFVQERIDFIFTVKTSLKEAENLFVPLLRCHHKYFVNRLYPWKIKQRKTYSFELVFQSQQVPIGKKYLDQVRSVFPKETL